MTAWQRYTLVLMTVDPVHIGTGGYRLGEVELSIVREPGTRLPKIPGTSISGAVRQYAAYQYNKPQCAGQKNHCRQNDCPICYTFGFATAAGGGYAGVVSFSDARILLFPVYSMVGPVWVTSPCTLKDFLDGPIQGLPPLSGGEACWGSSLASPEHLNLGWLMVRRKGDLPSLNLPCGIPDEVKRRVVVLSDGLFSHVVNANLEVRTSVSIDPETGAAEEKLLFTYEAIPRATFLWMDVIVDDYRGGFPNTTKKWNGQQHNAGDPLPRPWQGPFDVVRAGLEWAEHLGIGGMGTRGFGRIRLVWESARSCDEGKKEETREGNPQTEARP